MKGKQHLLEVPPHFFQKMQFYNTQLPAQKLVFKQPHPIFKVHFSTFSGLLIQLFTSCAWSHQNNHLEINTFNLDHFSDSVLQRRHKHHRQKANTLRLLCPWCSSYKQAQVATGPIKCKKTTCREGI